MSLISANEVVITALGNPITAKKVFPLENFLPEPCSRKSDFESDIKMRQFLKKVFTACQILKASFNNVSRFSFNCVILKIRIRRKNCHKKTRSESSNAVQTLKFALSELSLKV